MTDNNKSQILEVARRALHTEMLALGRLEQTLGDSFVQAVEAILASRGKCIVTGMGNRDWWGAKSPPPSLRPVRRVSSSIPVRPSTATWA